MKASIYISFLGLLILTIVGCKNSSRIKAQIIQKKYGSWEVENDSLGVELKLNKINTWKDLIKQTERIVCNDSIPKITLKSGNEVKIVFFVNPCWGNFGCILIKERNVIEIHNDTVNKPYKKLYTLDSLEGVLKRDFENNGKNPELSDSPEKLLIYVSYDNFESTKLLKTLHKLLETYEKVANKRDIKILLNERIILEHPIPPPPVKLEEIEDEE